MAVFMRRRGAKLGVSIHALEYIESTGTQYIDTGFKPNQDTRILMKAAPVLINAGDHSAFFFGSTYPDQQDGYEVYIYGPSCYAVYNSIQTPGGSNFQIGQILTIDFNKFSFSLYRDGENIFSTNFDPVTFTSHVNLGLCRLMRQNPFNGHVRVYACKIYDNEKLIRDYIPCKDPDGTVCLYDQISDEYVYNAGSGVFTAGPDI